VPALRLPTDGVCRGQEHDVPPMRPALRSGSRPQTGSQTPSPVGSPRTRRGDAGAGAFFAAKIRRVMGTVSKFNHRVFRMQSETGDQFGSELEHLPGL